MQVYYHFMLILHVYVSYHQNKLYVQLRVSYYALSLYTGDYITSIIFNFTLYLNFLKSLEKKNAWKIIMHQSFCNLIKTNKNLKVPFVLPLSYVMTITSNHLAQFFISPSKNEKLIAETPKNFYSHFHYYKNIHIEEISTYFKSLVLTNLVLDELSFKTWNSTYLMFINILL